MNQLQYWPCQVHTIKLRLGQKRRKDKMPLKKLATNTIKINWVKGDLKASLNAWLAEISASTVEEKWNAFKSILFKVSTEKFGTAVRKHEVWFDGNSVKLEELINNRNLARNNTLSKNAMFVKARYRTCCQFLRQRCRELKNKWWLTKTADV